MLKPRKSLLNNERGSAMIETIPIIIVIVTFLTFSLGFFGAIHSGVLNSIASRNYAFETFRHRADLTYFRTTGTQDVVQFHYDVLKFRSHAIGTEKDNKGQKWLATTRKIGFNFGQKEAEASGTKSDHNKTVRDLNESERNEKVGVNPIWIKTSYGICLNAACGA
ncbi:MAG: hypothetical protein J7501_10890 [Bdellovibrio sp.]|nr:hypothetical protein [Bdellovibrio sp.]